MTLRLFARPACESADLARLLAALASLSEDTRRAVAALLAATPRDTWQVGMNRWPPWRVMLRCQPAFFGKQRRFCRPAQRISPGIPPDSNRRWPASRCLPARFGRGCHHRLIEHSVDW